MSRDSGDVGASIPHEKPLEEAQSCAQVLQRARANVERSGMTLAFAVAGCRVTSDDGDRTTELSAGCGRLRLWFRFDGNLAGQLDNLF